MLQGLVLGSVLYLHSILATSLNIYTLMISKFLSFIQTIPLNPRLDILLPTHLFSSKYGFGFNLSKAKPLIFLLPQNLYSQSSPTQLMATASVPQARSFGVIYISFSPSYPIYQNPVDSALKYIQNPNTSPYPHHYHPGLSYYNFLPRLLVVVSLASFLLLLSHFNPFSTQH